MSGICLWWELVESAFIPRSNDSAVVRDISYDWLQLQSSVMTTSYLSGQQFHPFSVTYLNELNSVQFISIVPNHNKCHLKALPLYSPIQAK